MDIRSKKILILSSIVIFFIGSIALISYFLLVPKAPSIPSTQYSNKTVIIDNYSKYTSHISSDSFGKLGNYLYRFINNPGQGVYHAAIVDGSYTYSYDSWFSKFTVKLEKSDISWKVSMQTIKNGDINGDISITCTSSRSVCLSFSDIINSTSALQDHLPLNTDDYIITYQTGNYNMLSIVYYDQAGVGKSKALDKIKSLGFKPEDYTIKYYYGGH